MCHQRNCKVPCTTCYHNIAYVISACSDWLMWHFPFAHGCTLMNGFNLRACCCDMTCYKGSNAEKGKCNYFKSFNLLESVLQFSSSEFEKLIIVLPGKPCCNV